MMDANADAILDGNKFFQRHAAILGSTWLREKLVCC